MQYRDTKIQVNMATLDKEILMLMDTRTRSKHGHKSCIMTNEYKY